MRLVLFLASIPLLAAVGDHAPTLPSTYVTTHPRLGSPTTLFLNTIYNSGTMITRYADAANNWDADAPGTLINWRYLLTAYLADKQNAGPNNAAWLVKIKETMNELNGGWDYEVEGSWLASMGVALGYDWIYNDLDGTTRTNCRTALYTMMTYFEGNYTGSSPYNDQFYITGFRQMIHLVAALAIYPDDAATSLPHLRWSLDVWFNMLIPAWKQVFGCSTASITDSPRCGGMWPEAEEYTNQVLGLKSWYVTSTLAWANASGRGTAYFTTDEPWLKNWAYQNMYQTRPDMNLDNLQAIARPYYTQEYDGPGAGAYLGSLDGLAAIYNDTVLRGWSRLSNWNNAAPDGYEPSTWPWFTPDSSSLTATDRSTLAKVKHFPGMDTTILKTGWTEDDTHMTVACGGNNYWSHPLANAGAFTIFNRGALAIAGGSYRPGSNSPHWQAYGLQAISKNTLLVNDPSDVYVGELYTFRGADGMDFTAAMPNDGGQRRVGSDLSNIAPTSTYQGSPLDPSQHHRGWEWYHQGRMIAYSPGASYSYLACDITAAYNNTWSHGVHSGDFQVRQANTINRSYRVKNAVRTFTFIPVGTAAIIHIQDHVVSSNSTFVKTSLLHSVNEPSVTASHCTILRDDLITSKPFPDLWPQKWAALLTHDPSISTYQYDGELNCYVTLPAAHTITKVGGAGFEFRIGATNYDQCGYYGSEQCTAAEGTGPVDNYIASDPATAPHEPGGWRLEITPNSAALEDWFSVTYFASAKGANLISTAPATVSSGTNWVTTLQYNSNTCLVTITQPKNGVGGTVTATGAGCATVI